jgi:hypothetical protein
LFCALVFKFGRKSCSKWFSLKRAAPEQGQAATSHRPARRGPPPPRRLVPPARVPEVARAFPRPLRASRGLGRRERLKHRAAVRAREGPAVRSPSFGREHPQGAPVHPLVARRLALHYIGAAAPLPRRADPPSPRPTAPPAGILVLGRAELRLRANCKPMSTLLHLPLHLHNLASPFLLASSRPSPGNGSRGGHLPGRRRACSPVPPPPRPSAQSGPSHP